MAMIAIDSPTQAGAGSPAQKFETAQQSRMLAAGAKNIRRMTSLSQDTALLNTQQALQALDLDCFLIPSSDAHGSEYVSKRDERRGFVSNFDGSAGLAAVVTKPSNEIKSAIFTDSRYKLQTSLQLSSQWQSYISGEKNVPKLTDWLKDVMPTSRVGFDPRFSSISQVERWQTALKNTSVALVEVLDNPVDKVWEAMGRPPPPSALIWPLADHLSGATTATKVAELRKCMKKKGSSVAVVSALDDVAWLLNLRGGDIPYTPLFLAYCVVGQESGVTLCAHSSQLGKEAIDTLSKAGVDVREYEDIAEVLLETTGGVTTEGGKDDEEEEAGGGGGGGVNSKKVWLDPISANWHLKATCTSLGLTVQSDRPLPIALSKSIKNSVELETIKEAHLVDGVALSKYLCWLEIEMSKDDFQLDEVEAADRLEAFRTKNSSSFIGNSFSTISSSGPNGAIVHYEPTRGKCRSLSPNDVYLCDSGGQYKDPCPGTTDVTRCYKHAEPTVLEKQCYTAVLQGHIDLSAAIFPEGTEGYKLDVLARMPLFSLGKNYAHGTGHGVGHCSVVHEGPHGIGTKKRNFDEGLVAGMITSIEPGYYNFENGFGFRIENLAYVVPAEGRENFLSFQPLTMCPIESKFIDVSMLNRKQLAWLNEYHRKVRESLAPRLEDDGVVLEWLMRKTAPLTWEVQRGGGGNGSNL